MLPVYRREGIERLCYLCIVGRGWRGCVAFVSYAGGRKVVLPVYRREGMERLCYLCIVEREWRGCVTCVSDAFAIHNCPEVRHTADSHVFPQHVEGGDTTC